MEAPSVTAISHAWLSYPFIPAYVSKLKQLTVQSCSHSTPGSDLVKPHKLQGWVWMD